MKLDALDHPKTLDFAARLSIELPTALGHLELFWAFTGKQAAQGNIGKWPDGAISRACYWMGPPEVFIQALRDARFLDADPVHRLTVHDWNEHAPSWVRAKLKKLGLSFIPTGEPSSDGSSDDSEATSERSSEPSSEPSSRAPVLKGREEKGSEAKRASEPTAEGLDLKAWERWEGYRHDVRKPLKPASIPAAQRALAAFGSEQAAVVEQSIAHGWQGLFALKTASQNGNGSARTARKPVENGDKPRDPSNPLADREWQ